MRKFFILISLILPSIIFSQGVHKTNLILNGGVNFPVAGPYFKNNYKPSFNWGAQMEWTLGKITAIGFDFNIAKFPAHEVTPSQFNIKVAEDYSFTTLSATMKFQNNLAATNDFQFYGKIGAGGFVYLRGGDLQHGSGQSIGGLSVLTGAGVNYIYRRGDKVFIEAGHRFNPANGTSYNSVYINAGLSFCTNF